MSNTSAEYRTLGGEQAALGCVIWNPATLTILRQLLKPEDLGYEPHRYIFEAMCSLADEGKDPSDLYLLIKALERREMKASDAKKTVNDLNDAVSTDPEGRVKAGNVAHYAHEVLQAALQSAHDELARWHAEVAHQRGLQRAEASAGIVAETTRVADLERRLEWDGDTEEDDEPPGAPDEHGLEPFPLAALPKPIRDLAEEGARAIGCPPDFLALPALTAAGAAIGTSTGLEIKPGWVELPLLETAIVAEPGSAKSPAAELANKPITARQRKLDTTFQVDMKGYLAARDDETISDKPSEPKYQQVWTNDATLEALGDALEANPRGLLFMRDELAGWARAMNQYKGGKGADRQAWLSLWSCQSIMINRRGRKVPQHIYCPFVAVSGTIQPDILGELSDERGREDGFIHRILFAYPARMGRRWTEDTVSRRTEDAYSDLFEKLWELKPDPIKDAHGATIDDTHTLPHALKFTPAGKRAWVEWVTDHYSEMDAHGFPVNLRGPWSKMEGYAARFALIVHVCRRECGETASHDVDEVSMLAAAALVDYFKSHARAIYRQLRATPADKQAVDALAWIRRQPEQKTTARQLLTAGIGGVSNADEAKKLLEELQKRGYGKIEECPSKHGKPSFKFTLHAPASSNTALTQNGRAA